METLYLFIREEENFDGAIDQLGELATAEDFPKLVALHLEYYHFWKPESAARLEWLEQMCKEASVLCVPHHSSDSFSRDDQMMQAICPYNEHSLLVN